MKKTTAKKQSAVADNGCDLRGTAYINSATKPFRSNGVSSNAVSGGDLRVRKG